MLWLSVLLNFIANLGFASATVEITGLTQEPNRRQLEYTVRYHNGTAWSATPVPAEIPTASFQELFGKQFQIKYRRHQILWCEPNVLFAERTTTVLF